MRILAAIILLLLISCSNPKTDWKQTDLKYFKIDLPKKWTFVPLHHEDSFVGLIRAPSGNLNFDCSDMGYANHLLLTEAEFLKRNETPNNLTTAEKEFLSIAKNNVSNPSELKNIKAHYINIDSGKNFITKTIYPKIIGKGMTGIYIQSRTSTFNFQMNGNNLSKQDQANALKAFKTITFPQ